MATLTVLPSGHLHIDLRPDDRDTQTLPKSLLNALKSGLGKGLFQLACMAHSAQLPHLFHYWQQFAQHYMTHRCHLEPDLDDQHRATPLAYTDFVMLPSFEALLTAPPTMTGAEYFSMETLHDAWHHLDGYLCQQVNHAQVSLSAFLKQHASHWHQVGRVCLHLAENKQDEQYPFAFMATYVSKLTQQGMPRYHPLGNALKQLSNNKNKPELIRLLSPLDLASKHSNIIKDLLDTGDIYHPLAWTAHEAYQFLQEIPQYEAAGLAVRLPDWWKKRSRPKISVSIGNQTKNKLSIDALLDFKIDFTLGESKLTKHEWQQLMAAEDSLIFFKGQWVEVDKKKLSDALNHWQKMENAVANEGLSFAQGMRLLAGTSIDLKPDDGGQHDFDWSAIQAGAGLQTLLQQLRKPESVKPIQYAKSLQATSVHDNFSLIKQPGLAVFQS